MVDVVVDPLATDAHTAVALSMAACDAASASSTAAWASTTAWRAAASWSEDPEPEGAWASIAASTALPSPVAVAEVPMEVGEPPLPDEEPWLVDSPASAFDRASSAWASAASFSCSASVRLWVSSVASCWPTSTASPTATSTVATVPDTGNATAACETGSMVATPVSCWATSWMPTVAVR